MIIKFIKIFICLLALLFTGLAEAKVVTGILYYEIDNMPIEGAKVYASFSKDSTITDRNGWFKIRVDSADSEQLTFYARDCQSKSVKLENKHHLEVKLELVKIPLPDLLVIAELSFGTIERIGEKPGTFERVPNPDPEVRLRKRTKHGALEWQEEVLKTINYPRLSIEFGIEGEVYVEFSVSPSGEVTNASIRKGLSKQLDKEVLAVINTARSFTKEETAIHGIVEGKIQPRTYKMNVKFDLIYEE